MPDTLPQTHRLLIFPAHYYYNSDNLYGGLLMAIASFKLLQQCCEVEGHMPMSEMGKLRPGLVK